MSLTSRLKDPNSAVSLFMQQHFPYTKALTDPANKILRATGCPCPPPGLTDGSRYPSADVGRAIDYRIRYFYPPTSSRELVAWKGAQLTWQTAWRVDDSDTPPELEYPDIPPEVVEEFFDQLDSFLATVKPGGRLLDQEHEETLARFCYTLGLFEVKFRSRQTPEVFLLLPADQQSVEGLLAIAPGPVVTDLVDLAKLFYQRCGNLLDKPVNLNPNFAGSTDVGGADADLIIDAVLYELKTYKTDRVEPGWFRQLVGYLLLDYTDELQIRGLGVYMVRHGQRLVWPVREVLSALSGQVPAPDLRLLRAEFREVCQAATRIQRAAMEERQAAWLAERQAKTANERRRPRKAK